MFVACVGGGWMVFDTDVLIWVLRGNAKAARAVDRAEDRAVSVVTCMELMQGAKNKAEMRSIKAFLADQRFQTMPLTENIGHRASIYMEEYNLSVAMSMADALIAATVIETHEQLLTANDKHYKPIRELQIKRFRP